MTDKPRDNLILLNSRDRLTKESLKQKLLEIACAYGRARVREEYVKIKNVSQKELNRGIWRNDDVIFLEQEIETECARLGTEWTDRLETTVNEVIQDYLPEDDDEEK